MTHDRILLGHGGGGRLSRDLIDREIVARFGKGPLAGLPDAATLPQIRAPIIFTTDSFVVHPIEFPGGNIGHLAVHGTVNDIAVSGGRPLWLSVGLILEEGLPIEILQRVLDALKSAADDCNVQVVTGDTKVVRRGQCDSIYINTAGIGKGLSGFDLGTHRIKLGDKILVSGPLGDHGMAVLSAREGIAVQNGPQSDSAPVHRLVQAIADRADAVRFMRDPTRGGLASVLNEAVEKRDIGITLSEDALPFSSGAKAVAEMLGMDLLHSPSEGRMVCVCDPEAAEEILSRWHALKEGVAATEIGTVTGEKGRVILQTSVGGRRLIDVPQGELLPRIC